MCGIIGYLGPRDGVRIVYQGLQRLQYRGYDSAGIAFLHEGKARVLRSAGKLQALGRMLANTPSSPVVIGHTRWATHGSPSEQNAHPHRSGAVLLVHNGIIENYLELKEALLREGVTFSSETDTEVACHLIGRYHREMPLEEAALRAARELRGAYALVLMSEAEPQKLVGLRKDSPLVLGLGGEEFFLASDAVAFLEHTREVLYLQDDEAVVLSPKGHRLLSSPGGRPRRRAPQRLPWSIEVAERGGFKHFMLKEIHEQPRAIGDTIRGRIDPRKGEVLLQEWGLRASELKALKGIVLLACGTSWHAALAGAYLLEALARIPSQAQVASEFRYRQPVIQKDTLVISISQSGETADTLAAQRLARRAGAKVLCITNVVGSTASREAQAVFYTRCGPEIGVASTKTFTAQLVSLYMLALAAGRARGHLRPAQMRQHLKALLGLPELLEQTLKASAAVEQLARAMARRHHALFLGRGLLYPIALEGALKLKEISYIHAEGYPAGEMKHGPIALIDEEMPVVFLLPEEQLLRQKLLSNVQEVRSRGGQVVLLYSSPVKELGGEEAVLLRVPPSSPYLAPVLMSVPLQLLAYHTGVVRGCDVDQPRNLAKSVTVE
jgi:glucosamine--fructose-6-phosphate aminotransferase (isomerizing)